MGPANAGGAATQHGTRGQAGGEEEVEGRAEEWSGGGQKAETDGRPEKRRGEFRRAGGRRTRTTSERAVQGGGWATLLLSCLLLGFEIC